MDANEKRRLRREEKASDKRELEEMKASGKGYRLVTEQYNEPCEDAYHAIEEHLLGDIMNCHTCNVEINEIWHDGVRLSDDEMFKLIDKGNWFDGRKTKQRENLSTPIAGVILKYLNG